ncbi:unnamed protein product [Brassica oleracea]
MKFWFVKKQKFLTDKTPIILVRDQLKLWTTTLIIPLLHLFYAKYHCLYS